MTKHAYMLHSAIHNLIAKSGSRPPLASETAQAASEIRDVFKQLVEPGEVWKVAEEVWEAATERVVSSEIIDAILKEHGIELGDDDAD